MRKLFSEVCNMLKIPPVLSFVTCTDTGRISMLVTALADHLNVDVSDLPIAVTAPEWMEQKAEDVTGGKIALGDDPVKVAKNIETHIMAKRKGMGLS
jgi:carbon-monoxide dehydrogenase catalytic subunit